MLIFLTFNNFRSLFFMVSKFCHMMITWACNELKYLYPFVLLLNNVNLSIIEIRIFYDDSFNFIFVIL